MVSLIWVASLRAGDASATTIIARFGPAAAGQGGPNVPDIPPGAADTELSIVTGSKTEINIAVFPGILIGRRFDHDGFYGSGGAGAIISGEGLGLGGYAAIGYETPGTWKLNVDFKQAIGLAGRGLMSGYAVRVGAGVEF